MRHGTCLHEREKKRLLYSFMVKKNIRGKVLGLWFCFVFCRGGGVGGVAVVECMITLNKNMRKKGKKVCDKKKLGSVEKRVGQETVYQPNFHDGLKSCTVMHNMQPFPCICHT